MADNTILTEIPEATSALRLVREKKEDFKNEKKYKNSFKVIDELGGSMLAECDLFGYAGFVHLEIKDTQGNIITMKPNRKVMPSRWSFFGDDGQMLYQIKRPFFFVCLYPLRRTYFTITDKQTNRILNFIDHESSIGDMLFGTPPLHWAITDKGQIVARLRRIYREKEKDNKKGLFKKLKRLFKSSDWVLLTPGSTPVLNPAVYLGLVLLLEEHTNHPAH